MPTTLRVATANAASGRDHRGRPDLATWTASVADLEVDVLAVQEVDHLLPRSGHADQTAQIEAALRGDGPAWTARFAAAVHGTPGRADTMRPARTTEAGEPSYGVALLSRQPVRRWRELRLPASRVRLPTPAPPDDPARVLWAPDEQRVAVAAVVAAPGGDVSVVGTHLSFSPPRAAAQLRRVRAWAASLPRPLLLLGDLNLPGGVPGRLTGWREVVRVATYPAPAPRVQLDHVLLDPGGRSVEVLDAGARRVGASDHLALRAELALGPTLGA